MVLIVSRSANVEHLTCPRDSVLELGNALSSGAIGIEPYLESQYSASSPSSQNMNLYLTLFLGLVTALLALYYTFIRPILAFRRDGILFKTPMPLLGNMWGLLLRRKSLADIVHEIYNIHPTAKYVGFMDLLTPIIVIRDLDLIKSITVKHFDQFMNHRTFINEDQDELFGKNLFALRDERWREVRNMLSPAFTSSKMKQMFVLMSNCARDFADFMAKLPDDKKCMDVKDALTRYTNDVIATCAFGISIDSMKNPNNDFYVLGKDATNFDSVKTLKTFIIRSFPNLTAFLGMSVLNKRTVKFFTEIIGETIRTRDEKGIHRPDMIQLMMDARGKFGEGRDLNLIEMTSQAFIFFFGGFDTTSTLMSFVAHELAVNPDIQNRLREEVDEVMEACNGQLTYDKLNEMEYLDALIYETLRMWPIVPSLDRVCTKRFELPPALPGKKPYVLERGSYVWIPAYGFQRDPEYFENPEKFWPDRFLDKEKKLANQPSFFPFGLGPRMCIGNRFALLEVKVMLFHLVHRCELSPSAKTQIPLKISKSSFTTQAEKGFWLQIKPRSDKPKTSMTNGTAH